MNITYHHDKQLAFSQAYTFVFEGYAAMLREGLTHAHMDFSMASELIYAKDGDKIVGAQLFSCDKVGRCFTQYAYVDPAYRGRGIAVKIFEHLERQIKGRPGMTVVYTSAVDENEKVQKVFAKTGRDQYTARFAKFYKDVTQL